MGLRDASRIGWRAEGAHRWLIRALVVLVGFFCASAPSAAHAAEAKAGVHVAMQCASALHAAKQKPVRRYEQVENVAEIDVTALQESDIDERDVQCDVALDEAAAFHEDLLSGGDGHRASRQIFIDTSCSTAGSGLPRGPPSFLSL